jgi:hypothetical protein
MKHLYLGCTAFRHAQIGVNAIVNARAGRQHLNDLTIEDVEMQRDARNIRARIEKRVRFYQFNSRHFRRRMAQLKHLLSNYRD